MQHKVQQPVCLSFNYKSIEECVKGKVVKGIVLGSRYIPRYYNGAPTRQQHQRKHAIARNTAYWRWPAGGGRGAAQGVPGRGQHQRPL